MLFAASASRRASTWASAYDFHHQQAEATPASPASAWRPATRLCLAECRALLTLAAISRTTGDMTAAEHHTAEARHIQRETGYRPAPEPQ